MRKLMKHLVGAAAMTAVVCVATAVWAESCTLELKRLESQRFSTADYMYQATYPQSFFMQMMKSGNRAKLAPMENGGQTAAFKKIVTKEPKYASECPFRGVMKLGSQEYAFALDAVPPKPDAKEAKAKDEKAKAEAKKAAEKSKAGSTSGTLIGKIAKAAVKATASPEPAEMVKAMGYNRLYFDFNHNGDLTDDKVVEADNAAECGSRLRRRTIVLRRSSFRGST